MIARLRALPAAGQVLLALAVAVVLGAVVSTTPVLTNPVVLLACAALLVVLAVLTQWLWQHQHGTDWSNSFTDKTPPRGTDPRITRLAERVDAAVGGDAVAQLQLHEAIRALAEERLRRHRGIDLDGDDTHRARAALGPKLTAYLANPPTTRLTVAHVDEFVTTLEEL